MNRVSKYLNVVFAIGGIALLGGCGGSDKEPAESFSEEPTNGSSENLQPEEPGSGDIPPPDSTPINTSKSVTISWPAPTTRNNADPLPLAEIDGYIVYYYRDGTAVEDAETLIVENPDTREITTPLLESGTYHFSVSSGDTELRYSEKSETVTVTID